MRRNDREVTDIEEIRRILKKCKTCHLAMTENGKPYIVPLNFGYEFLGSALIMYFHSAKEGRKLDILHKNPAVCFELCHEGELTEFDNPCNASCYYESVIGFGSAEFIEAVPEKAHALTFLMQQQTGRDFVFSEAQTTAVCVFKVVTTDFTGKRKQKP